MQVRGARRSETRRNGFEGRAPRASQRDESPFSRGAALSYGGASDDDAALRPAHGGRVLLALRDVSATHAHYDVALAEPQAVWRVPAAIVLDATIGADAAVTFEGSEASPWLVAQARRFLVALAKECRGEGAAPWPARQLRWRAPR
jgi:hypothetical protein